MLVQGLVTCRRFQWLTALHVVVLLPSSVSAAPCGSCCSCHCWILICWILLLSCGACLLWPILIAVHSRPPMFLCCAVVSQCMDLHALHMKGWLWLTLLRRRKEGLGGSASRPTLMVNPVVFPPALVCVCVCECWMLKLRYRKKCQFSLNNQTNLSASWTFFFFTKIKMLRVALTLLSLQHILFATLNLPWWCHTTGQSSNKNTVYLRTVKNHWSVLYK